MTTIKINNVDYDTDKLSDEAKAQLVSLQYCDQELARLQAKSAALQTARIAYGKALQSELPAMPTGDTLKFDWFKKPTSSLSLPLDTVGRKVQFMRSK